jgi:chromosome segregation ATPase
VKDATAGSGQGLAAHTRQSLRQTRRKLELALGRLVKGNPRVVRKDVRLSASSVAKEAGVDRATVYRFHEPVLTEIRRINDSGTKAKLEASRAQTHEAGARLKEYRKLVEQAQEEVAALARINYRLQARIDELESHLHVRDERIAEMQKQLNARPRTR